jgi:DNA topoisomerase-3
MVGAIDAVCDVALRILGKLTEGGGTLPPGESNGAGSNAYPPTPAMKRYAESLARQKGLSPPTGYDNSISICRAFLDEHDAKKADVEEKKPEARARTRSAPKARKDVGLDDNAQVASIAKLAPLKAKRAMPRARSGRECMQTVADIPATTRKTKNDQASEALFRGCDSTIEWQVRKALAESIWQ